MLIPEKRENKKSSLLKIFLYNHLFEFDYKYLENFEEHFNQKQVKII